MAEAAHLVWSIMLRPKAVTEEEISRQGILPTIAPVKPYTLFALTCNSPYGSEVIELGLPVLVRVLGSTAD